MTNATVAIVGGIPNPIGGVTTFIRRVIRREQCVTHLFDIYPSDFKSIPNEYGGKYICKKNKLFTMSQLWLFLLAGRVDMVHFNFSTPRALFFLLLLPKRKVKWLLTLHHGDLGKGTTVWGRWVLSRKVDYVLSLNDRQSQWYAFSVPPGKILPSTSYVPPSPPCPSPEFVASFSTLKCGYQRVFVCSGYPKALYNHLLIMEVMRFFPDSVLFCCLYGEGDLKEEIISGASQMNNVVLFDELDEEDFNYLLSGADLYFRITSEDSFGIAVADSLVFGGGCISSDVCPRYPGATLVSPFCSLMQLKEAVESVFSVSCDLPKSSGDFSGFSYEFINQLSHD